jgi:5-methylcytosine-specific restriction protein A
MDAVRSEIEIKENVRTFEQYLCEGNSEEQQFAHDLVARGRCFVAYRVGAETRFSPSRYIGYAHNTRESHLENLDKDGRETNAAINRVIGYTLGANESLEERYLRFASELGIQPFDKRRKYWPFDAATIEFGGDGNVGDEFPEGKLVERKHLSRERSAKLVSAAKRKFIEDHGRLFCNVCGFDYEAVYGSRGKGFIEAHHTIPVSELRPGDKTKVADIAIVCANCHRMLHRARPWLRMGELSALVKSVT